MKFNFDLINENNKNKYNIKIEIKDSFTLEDLKRYLYNNSCQEINENTIECNNNNSLNIKWHLYNYFTKDENNEKIFIPRFLDFHLLKANSFKIYFEDRNDLPNYNFISFSIQNINIIYSFYPYDVNKSIKENLSKWIQTSKNIEIYHKNKKLEINKTLLEQNVFMKSLLTIKNLSLSDENLLRSTLLKESIKDLISLKLNDSSKVNSIQKIPEELNNLEFTKKFESNENSKSKNKNRYELIYNKDPFGYMGIIPMNFKFKKL
jgi:hypothetical protein